MDAVNRSLQRRLVRGVLVYIRCSGKALLRHLSSEHEGWEEASGIKVCRERIPGRSPGK